MTDPWLTAYVLTLVAWSFLIGTCYVKVVCCDGAGVGAEGRLMESARRGSEEYYSLLDV